MIPKVQLLSFVLTPCSLGSGDQHFEKNMLPKVCGNMCLGNVGTHPPATGLSQKDQDMQTVGHLYSSTT